MKQNFVPKEAYWKEYLESNRVPARVKKYQASLNLVAPEVREVMESMDALLDKALEVCHTHREADMETNLMRARWCLGMD